MQASLKDTLDRFAAGAGHQAVDKVLDEAGRPRKTAIVIAHPRAHPLYFQAVKEKD
jgi:hypothetical protein